MSSAFYDIKIPMSSTFVLPQFAVNAVIASKNADCAMLLLYIVKNSGYIDDGSAIHDLGLTNDRYREALSLLISEKIIIPTQNDIDAVPAKPAEMKTDYSPEEIRSALDGDAEFASIYRACESALARPLKQYETGTLMSVYNSLDLPSEVILLLISYKSEEYSKRIAAGTTTKRLTVREIAGEACRWNSAGIFTLEAADEYIRQLQQKSTMEGQLKRLLGIRDRRPSPTELAYIKSFIDMGFEFAVIERAYDITVVNKGSLIWPYMNSILKRWQREGKLKLSDLEAANINAQRPSAQSAQKQEEKLTDVNYEYFERVKQYINKEDD